MHRNNGSIGSPKSKTVPQAKLQSPKNDPSATNPIVNGSDASTLSASVSSTSNLAVPSLPRLQTQLPQLPASTSSVPPPSLPSTATTVYSPRTNFLQEQIRRRIRIMFTGNEQKSIRKNLLEKLRKRPLLILKDKLSFFLGVLNMALTQFMLFNYPEYFGIYYTLWIIPLLVYRFFVYTSRKWSLFMLDFCYFTNILCLLHLWIYPTSPYLFETTFILSNGPLIWAVVAWRNSLVFHDIDKMTSLFIHIAPPLVMFTQRWYYWGARIQRPDILPPYLSCLDPSILRQAKEHVYETLEDTIKGLTETIRHSQNFSTRTTALADTYACCSWDTATSHGGIHAVTDICRLTDKWKCYASMFLSTVVTLGATSLHYLYSFLSYLFRTTGLSRFLSAFPGIESVYTTISSTVTHYWASFGLPSFLTPSLSSTLNSNATIPSIYFNVTPEQFIPVIDIAASPPSVTTDSIPYLSFFTTCDMSYYRILGIPLFTYILWQILYLLYTEIHVKQRIQQNPDELNSLRWMVRAGKGPLHDLSLSCARTVGLLKKEETLDSENWRTKVIFVFMQFVYTILTILPTKYFYENYVAHGIFLLTMLAAAVWHGANYYFDVFAKRYFDNLKELTEQYAKQQEVQVQQMAEKAVTEALSLMDSKSQNHQRNSASMGDLTRSSLLSPKKSPTVASLPSTDENKRHPTGRESESEGEDEDYEETLLRALRT